MLPPDNKRQLLKTAYHYARAGHWEQALAEYRRASGLFPEDPNIHAMIADILSRRGEREEAAEAYLAAARLYKAQDADDKELLLLKKALKAQPANAEAAALLQSRFERQMAMAAALLSQGEFAKAEELAQKILEANPDQLPASRLLDDLRARRLQEEAILSFVEEERLAAVKAPLTDDTGHVRQQLKATVEKYLVSEDFVSAIETLRMMSKSEGREAGQAEEFGNLELLDQEFSEKTRQEKAAVEAEKLRHAMELEKMELEIKAHESALQDLKEKLEAERAENERRLKEERRRSAEAEAALSAQIQELMRQEMSKLRDELVQKSVAELVGRLEEERRQREGLERQFHEHTAEALRRFQEDEDRVKAAKQIAEERAGKEREAISKLKAEDEQRKQRLMEDARRRREILLGASGADLKEAVLRSSRKISDTLHAAVTKHMEQDLDKMLESARRYLDQNLLLDSMRVCQKITALDPDHQQVKALLKEIYVKKGL